MQKIQNRAARIVKKISRHERITPVLRELHWLPVEQRVKFKVAVLTYKSLNEMAPQYLTELIELYRPSRHLRSSSSHLLVVNRTNTKSFGNKSFIHTAAEVWNALQIDIKLSKSLDIFKSRLKTTLFEEYFAK